MWRAVSDGQSLTARPLEGAQESPGGMAGGKLPKTAERVPRPRAAGNPGSGVQRQRGKSPGGTGFTQGQGRAGSEGRHAQL